MDCLSVSLQIRTKHCFAAIRGEEPSKSYKKYLKDINNITHKPRKRQEEKMQPSDVFDLAERTSTYNTSNYATESNDVSASTLRKRCVAVTNDINIQGMDRWFNGIDFFD